MAMFHCYVSLPEGKPLLNRNILVSPNIFFVASFIPEKCAGLRSQKERKASGK
jgi:hypothetical protein